MIMEIGTKKFAGVVSSIVAIVTIICQVVHQV